MEEVTKNCDLVLTELNKFSKDMVNLGPAISDDRLEIFENELNFELRVDFKYILKRHNGVSLSGNEICGIDESYGGQSLDKLYEFEHDDGPNKMPLLGNNSPCNSRNYTIEMRVNEVSQIILLFTA